MFPVMITRPSLPDFLDQEGCYFPDKSIFCNVLGTIETPGYISSPLETFIPLDPSVPTSAPFYTDGTKNCDDYVSIKIYDVLGRLVIELGS